jgi:hypothetical protein
LAATFLAVTVVYVSALVLFSPLPLQDAPNHLARAAVMADLMFRHGRQFGSLYSYHFLLVPYILGDLVLACLVQLLGPVAAGALWSVLAFLSLPCALFAYLKARRTAADATAVLLLLSLFLATDSFFVMGFFSFRLAVAFVFFGLAAVERLRRDWSLGTYLGFVALMIAAYLTHFAAIIFLVGAIGASGALRLYLRTSRVGREVLLLAPLAAILAWHFLMAAGYRQPQDAVAEPDFWGTLGGKFQYVLWDLERYGGAKNVLLMLSLAACLYFTVSQRKFLIRSILEPGVLEPWFLALTFLGLYIVLPSVYAGASFVDVRALALVAIFFLVGWFNVPPRVGGRSQVNVLALGCALVLVLGNLAYLGKHFRDENRWIGQYRLIVAKIPLGARVLPVYTAVKQGVTRYSLHVPSYATLDRTVLEPYLFTADNGSPMKYFRYIQRPYAPDEAWYHSEIHPEVDWRKAAADYEYLLVMRPFDPGRIGLSAHKVEENGTATLLAIDKSQ